MLSSVLQRYEFFFKQQEKEKKKRRGMPLCVFFNGAALASGIFFRADADDDEVDFDFLGIGGLGVECGGGGTFNLSGCHSSGTDMVFGDAVLNEEFLDRFSAFERDELVMFGVDTIGMNKAFDHKGDIRMVLEHLDVGDEDRIGFLHQF